MAVTLGGLSLGTVRDVTFEHSRRLSEVDIPTAEGSSTEDLGKQGAPINLTGALSGESRFSDFGQLERVSRIGRSLKFDCDMLQTVVFLKTVKLTRQTPTVLNYALALKQSRFKKVNACDLTDYWSVDSGGGSLSAVTSSPTPKEGLACLKLSGTIGAGVASRLKYTPADLVDLNFFDWPCFWFQVSSLATITSAYVKAYVDGGDYASYDFSSLLTAANTWLKIRVFKDSFSVTGSMEWDEVAYVTIEVTKSGAETDYFAIDDLGGDE